MLGVTRREVGRASRDANRGQALAEFALIAPVFFLLIFGVIQLGILFGGQNALVNTAREVARYAATYRSAVNDPASACSAVLATVSSRLASALPGYDPIQVTPDVSYGWLASPSGTSYSMAVTITIAYRHPLYVPLISQILDGFDGSVNGRLRLVASEEMRVESTPLPAPADPSAVITECP